jgi:hypothetical protein
MEKDNTSYAHVELTDYDKRIFAEIEQHIANHDIGESLKCINHAINEYLNKALLQTAGFKDGMFDTPDKQREALDKIIKNSLKASMIAKQLKKLYHL